MSQETRPPTPPGLEESEAGATLGLADALRDVQTVASSLLEERLKDIAVDGNKAALDVFRRCIQDEVERKLLQRYDDLLKKGKTKTQALQQKQDEEIKGLNCQVDDCLQRQRTLETQNTEMRRVLGDLSSNFRQLGDLCANAVASSTSMAASSGATTPGRSDGPVQPAGVLCLEQALHVGSVSLPKAAGVAVDSEGGGFNFTFTLRKADGHELGLNLAVPNDGETSLRVEGVLDNGAVHSWNRMWLHHPQSSYKAVVAGDEIISVNGITGDTSNMLQEIKEKQLIKVTVRRGHWLRADASEFIPANASPSTPRSA